MLSHNIHDVLPVKLKHDFTGGTWLWPFKCLNGNLSSARDIHRQFPSLFIPFIPPVFLQCLRLRVSSEEHCSSSKKFSLKHFFLHKPKNVDVFKYFDSTASALPDATPYRNVTEAQTSRARYSAWNRTLRR